jgi:hypothetical protein
MKQKVIYWVSTGLFSAMMLFAAYNYFANETVKGAFVHLGFPDYFRVELAIAKVLGAAALLIPVVPRAFKNFAYAGFTINLVSAVIAHLSLGDPVSAWLPPLVFLGVLVGSFISYQKVIATKRPELKTNEELSYLSEAR